MQYIFKLVSALLCLILVVPIISCGKPDISDPLAENSELMDDIENNWVPLMSEEEAEKTMGLSGQREYYNGCIYYMGNSSSYEDEYTSNQSQMYTLLRYNMNTGAISPACRDSACTHRMESCPFYFRDPKKMISFRIVDDTLYYFTASKRAGHIDTSKKGEVYCYNLKTLQYKKLFELDVNNNSDFFCFDDSIYYTQCDFHKDDNGYDQSVWSYDLDSGKKEKLFVYGDENDTPLYGRSAWAVDNQGYMIFIKLPADYESLNLESPQTIVFERAELKKGAKVETVVEIEAAFGVPALETLCYHDGKILFQEVMELTYVSLKGIQIERGLYDLSVRYVDVETGEFGTLLEHTTLGFDIAGDYLYTRPFMPEIIDLENGTQDVYLTGGKFIQFNIKTGEHKEYPLGLGEDVEFYNSSKFTYVRGRLFGYLQNYATGETRVPIEYDIATAEMRKVPETIINPSLGYR